MKYFNEKFKLQVNVTLKSYNSFGEEVPINFKDAISFKLTPYYFLMRLESNPLRSVSEPDKVLGSVLFGESFIL